MERLIRSAAALLLGVLASGAPAVALGGAETGPAEIELRKTFRPIRRANRQPDRSTNRNDGGSPRVAVDRGEISAPQLGAVAAALGEQLQSSGTLHLPDVGGRSIVLRGAMTPILETVAGRHLILDRDRTIDPGAVAAIPRRWPGFAVVQPPAGAGLREVIGSILDASGYDAVLRSTPLIFGRGITLRVTPDFVVLRTASDLLAGETRALSVVDPAAALPSELRELAGEQRVLLVELTPDGAVCGVDPSPWRDAAGRVTTMESARPAPIIEEIAGALGLSIEDPAQLPAGTGEKEIGAELTVAIGAMLRRCGVPALGPVVELFREPSSGSPRRFVISVPGWLAEAGGRRLLITGAAVPPLVRLFLTRAGIDIFEYRIRDGR